MTYFYYKNSTWQNEPQVSKETLDLWKSCVEKKNWRITQLHNGYYQAELKDSNDEWKGVTRRESVKAAEKAIDASIEHYAKKLKLAEGPVVVKTFK